MATPTNEFFNKLEGTWMNKLGDAWDSSLGWSFISQPRLGQAGPMDFMMRTDMMRETITFKKLGVARNVGIDGQAGFWDGMSYVIEIKNSGGDDIHQEMGHFLLEVKDREPDGGETQKLLRAPIIRQASIPRANAILTPGELRIGNVGEAQDIYDGKPTARDPDLQKRIDAELAVVQLDVSEKGGPNLQEPLTWLREQHPVLVPGTIDWVFDFHKSNDNDSMASGQRVDNPVGIGSLLSAFWIGDRRVVGEDVSILQYAQVVDIRFNGMNWPHTAVNTLFKQPA